MNVLRGGVMVIARRRWYLIELRKMKMVNFIRYSFGYLLEFGSRSCIGKRGFEGEFVSFVAFANYLSR